MTVSVNLSTTTPDNGETFGLEASGLPDEPVYVEMDGAGNPTRLFDPFPGGSVVLGIRSAVDDVDESVQLKKASDGSDLGSPIAITVGSPAVAPTVTAPGTPTGLTLVAGDASIFARCTAPVSDGGSPIIDYVWRRGGTIIARTSSTSYLFTGLTNGTSYSITVSAENSAGEGSQTGSVSATPVATAPGPEPGSEPAEASGAENASLAAAIAAGGSVSMLDRIYRIGVATSAACVLSASDNGKAEIRGSDIWTGWSGTGPWTSTLTVPAMPMNSGTDGRYSAARSLLPEQVFVDGEPMLQLPSGQTPAAGQFKIDASRHVVLGTNPAGKRVEVTTRRYWIQTTANLTLHGVWMRHAGNDAQPQSAALRVNGGRLVADQGWRLLQCHGTLLGVLGGTSHQLTDGRLTEAGQLGYGLTGGIAGLLMQRVEIDHCNDQGYSPFWEAGAGKSTSGSNVGLDDCDVHDIAGNGPWWDIGPNTGAFARNCRIRFCDFAGLHFEISSGGLFEDNAIWECGWGDPRSVAQDQWPWGSGILISTSGHAVVRRNTIAWCRGGIALVNQPRTDGLADRGTYLTQHDNVVAGRSLDYMLAGVQDYVGPLFTTATNVGGSAVGGGAVGGRYYASSRFAWANGVRDLAGINATSIEEGATSISSGTKDTLLAAAGIPTSGTH